MAILAVFCLYNGNCMWIASQMIHFFVCKSLNAKILNVIKLVDNNC